MTDEPRVWIRKRKLKSGRTTYHLRWIDPTTGRWRSRGDAADGRKIGGDRKRAEREAALLQDRLDRGTHRDLQRVTWQEFVDEHVAKLPGADNASEARRVLEEFGKLFGVPPKRVTYAMVESYVQHLKTKGMVQPKSKAKPAGKKAKGRKPRPNSPATINKKLRYLRAAFNRAIMRGYIARNPMDGWQWDREEDKAPRIASEDEETALLDVAETLHGFKLRAFIVAALATGARRGELLALTWDRVSLDPVDDAHVLFTMTKGKKDRRVPITPEVVAVLRKLQAQTLREGGPFVGWAPTSLDRWWHEVVAKAKVGDITMHDLRRTCATRLIRASVPLPTVQRLMGHADIETTLRYYHHVSDDDMRAAVRKLQKPHGAG